MFMSPKEKRLNCGSRFRGLKSIFNMYLPTSLIVREGAVTIEDVHRFERRLTKVVLGLILVTIMHPMTLIYLGFIFLILCLCIRSIRCSYCRTIRLRWVCLSHRCYINLPLEMVYKRIFSAHKRFVVNSGQPLKGSGRSLNN